MIPHAPVDPRTAALLDLIAGDPRHEDDRAEIVRAILETARENAGRVDPNVLRAKLTNEWGSTVYPACIGATVNALARRGVLRFDRWVITEGSETGNNGRPARSYTLTDRNAA